MNLLKTIRVDAGYTQAEMGERLGVSQGEVSRTERRTDCLISTLAKWVRAVGAPLEIRIGSHRFRVVASGPRR